jgi:anaerobic selenocysteine-containing dehydrogenase
VFVALNATDANRLGVLDGDRVRIVSRRGSMVAPAKVGDVVPPGVVFVPFQYGDLGEEHAAKALGRSLELLLDAVPQARAPWKAPAVTRIR